MPKPRAYPKDFDVLADSIAQAMGTHRRELEAQIRQRDERIAQLERRLTAFETILDGEQRLRQVAAQTEKKLDQRAAVVERLEQRLDAILEREGGSTARLRQ